MQQAPVLSQKSQWGIFFCVAAILLLGGGYFLFFAAPPDQYPSLYQKTLPITGLFFSALVLVWGHFSYSKIHSIKVYFIGYCTGSAGIFFFTLCNPLLSEKFFPPVPHGLGEFIVLVAQINLIAIILIPSTTKYRTIRSLTLCAVAIETALYCIFRFGTGSALWLKPLIDSSFWISLAFLVLVFLLSFWKIRDEFFLGGIVAGCSILFLAAWMSRRIDQGHAEPLLLLFFVGALAFCVISLVIHGFFRMGHRIAYDPLLKIYNRDYCSRIITEQANLNVAPPFGIAMVDIDHFKQVNDTYGHQAGDAVLHSVSQAVHMGAGPDGIVCRYGGEELAVFFPQRTASEVGEIMEKIRKEIGKAKTSFGRKTITVTISTGVSCREQFTQSIVDVIHAADKALYAAKEEGRNLVKCQKTLIKSKQ